MPSSNITLRFFMLRLQYPQLFTKDVRDELLVEVFQIKDSECVDERGQVWEAIGKHFKIFVLDKGYGYSRLMRLRTKENELIWSW